MNCPNCGNELHSDEKFCSRCGSRNAGFVPPASAQEPPKTMSENGVAPVQPVHTPVPPPNAVYMMNQQQQTSQQTKRYESFAKAGLWLSISAGICFLLMLICTFSAVGASSANAMVSLLMWVGFLFFATMIVGILGIVFSAMAVGKQHSKRGIAITGLVLSIVFTAICLIIYLAGVGA